MQFLKYVLATIIGLFLFFFLGFLIFMGIAMSASKESSVTIKPNSLLKISLNEAMSDRGEEGGFNPDNLLNPIQEAKLGLKDVIGNIQKAAKDDNIKGIYLSLSGMPLGFAQMDEVRQELEAFKEAGKFIVAYGSVMTQKAYYMGSVADEIYINPQGLVELKGLGSTLMFFKNALDRLEIEPQIFYAGNFKSATEPFRLEKMSEYNRLQTQELLNDVNDKYIATVAKSRNMSDSEFTNIMDQLLVRTSGDAVQYKVVDDTLYLDQVHDILREKLGIDEDDKISAVSISKYNKVKGEDKKGDRSNRIAVIYAEGSIVDGKGDDTSIGGDRFAEVIRKVRRDDKTKAIVLRVNSGGGSALASDIMWRELKLAREAGIPVVASMGNVAASGGYYISCNADTILAEENTITGSIGVFGMLANMEKFYNNKLGITFDTVKTTSFSDFPSSPILDRSLKEEEKAIIQQGVDEIYDVFLQRVANGRALPKSSVHEVAQGRVWTGTQAKKHGLVDVIGGLEDAVDIAAQMAGFEEGDYRIYNYPKREKPIEKLLKSLGESAKTDAIKEELGPFYHQYQQLKQLSEMQGIQARIPFEIEIH